MPVCVECWLRRFQMNTTTVFRLDLLQIFFGWRGVGCVKHL
jgi:hypothetical protein